MAPEKPVFKEATPGKLRPPLVLTLSMGSSLLIWALKRPSSLLTRELKTAEMLLLVTK